MAISGREQRGLQQEKRVDWGCLFKTLRAPINHLNQLLLPDLLLNIVLNVIPSPSETCVPSDSLQVKRTLFTHSLKAAWRSLQLW